MHLQQKLSIHILAYILLYLVCVVPSCIHGLHCNLSKIHAVTCSDPRMIFFERVLRITSNNDKVLGASCLQLLKLGPKF